ncbi:unnamed protein product [Timema podura]|uniref:Uncharacterized protein n=1 Tax=Timema podura TaxID=61482 RepID=A0ABN7P3B5_TIMPD|nr:unnamed protein product [Timema podura]
MKNGAFDEQGAKKMMDSEFKKESERVQKMAELKACLQKEPQTSNDPCVSGPIMCACARKVAIARLYADAVELDYVSTNSHQHVAASRSL